MSSPQIVIAIVLCCFGLASAEDSPPLDQRIADDRGGFSMRPPKGWTEVEHKGLKYTSLLGPRSNGFTPNINFSDHPFDPKETLDAYVERNMPAIEAVAPKFKLLKKSELKLDSGTRAVVLATTNEAEGMIVKQTYFIFDGIENRRWIVCCSALASDASFDNVFEVSAKTFLHEKKGVERVKAVVKLQPGERYTEGKGHYSFIPPDNWELRDQDGYEFKIACGPRVDKIRPNIGFTSEATNTELAQFSSHTMTKSLNLDEKDLQKGVVKLDSGDDAIRIVGTVESNNHKFEMRGYFIKREGKVFMMMATLPENEKGLEEISDKCFQSLKFENP